MFQSSVFCFVVWFSLSFEEKLSVSLCKLLGSQAVCSEELRPEIMVYLIGSKKHSGGWVEGSIQNICAQSKLSDEPGLEELVSLQKHAAIGWSCACLLSGVKLKRRNFKKFLLSSMFEGIRIARCGQNRKTQLLK